MLTSWLDTIAASAANTNLVIVGTHLDKVRKEKEKGFPERMRELVWELVSLPKYNRINVKGIKEVSCAVDNREGIFAEVIFGLHLYSLPSIFDPLVSIRYDLTKAVYFVFKIQALMTSESPFTMLQGAF